MAKIPFSFGGGGDSSDDCTAEAADILESKTAIYNGSEDDAAAGTMKDYSGTSQQATGAMNSSSSRVEYTVPATGKYDTAAKLYLPYSTMRSLIGYTDASKVLTGTTICGLAGTMANIGSIDPAKSESLSSGVLYVRMSNGAHITNASSGYPEVSIPQADLASAISLTAAKLATGSTVLGIAGTANTWTSGEYLDMFDYGTQYSGCDWHSWRCDSFTISGDNMNFTTSGLGTAYYHGIYSIIPFDIRKYTTIAITYTSSSTDTSTDTLNIAIGISNKGVPTSDSTAWSVVGYISRAATDTQVEFGVKGTGNYIYLGNYSTRSTQFVIRRIRFYV